LAYLVSQLSGNACALAHFMPSHDDAISQLYRYLSLEGIDQPAGPYDWVIGFGHFDLAIARECGAAAERGEARRVAFTGGIGAGTADLGMPEADAFRLELERAFPALAGGGLVCENRSTNTGDNMRFLLALFAGLTPPVTPEKGLDAVLLVATPIRLRRVLLTVRHFLPDARLAVRCPRRRWQEDQAPHDAKGVPWLAQMVGEVQRIRDYPAKGWIAREDVPPGVLEAAAALANAA
jgi:hypothetical protein